MPPATISEWTWPEKPWHRLHLDLADNGRQFVSGEFVQFTKINGIRHTKTSPYNPNTNGLAERYIEVDASQHFIMSLRVDVLSGVAPPVLRDDAASSFVDHLPRLRCSTSAALYCRTPKDLREPPLKWISFPLAVSLGLTTGGGTRETYQKSSYCGVGENVTTATGNKSANTSLFIFIFNPHYIITRISINGYLH
ncbi:K02A2.6-like [Cordylochernes scorpioides]|uniref:K02A2.6-like n=1 Tax=Cordylochernes scorpioides TaxID=51811 RepID=A0ABY6KDN6_9ARAC|nr:K02A2.6-like [Cordylochernes scorpioides]